MAVIKLEQATIDLLNLKDDTITELILETVELDKDFTLEEIEQATKTKVVVS
jgi:hypothetical protein